VDQVQTRAVGLASCKVGLAFGLPFSVRDRKRYRWQSLLLLEGQLGRDSLSGNARGASRDVGGKLDDASVANANAFVVVSALARYGSKMVVADLMVPIIVFARHGDGLGLGLQVDLGVELEEILGIHRRADAMRAWEATLAEFL
jgi:hypothetical protein